MDREAYAKHNKPETGAKPGVYKHPATSEELHASDFPHADAFVRQGWVYDRPLPPAEDRRNVAREEVPSVDEVKKLREQLKAEKAARKAAEAEAEEAKAAAGEAMQASEDASKPDEAKTKSDVKEKETK